MTLDRKSRVAVKRARSSCTKRSAFLSPLRAVYTHTLVRRTNETNERLARDPSQIHSCAHTYVRTYVRTCIPSTHHSSMHRDHVFAPAAEFHLLNSGPAPRIFQREDSNEEEFFLSHRHRFPRIEPGIRNSARRPNGTAAGMIRACTHEGRGGIGKPKRGRKIRERGRGRERCVRLFLSREYIYIDIDIHGLTFLSAEDRRASTRMAHRKSSTMRFARSAMRVARARLYR